MFQVSSSKFQSSISRGHSFKITSCLRYCIPSLSLFVLAVAWYCIPSLGFCQVSASSGETTSLQTERKTDIQIKHIAILPFDNLSEEPDAAKRITTILLTELFSRSETFNLMELGEVEKALIDERVRSTGEIEVEVAKKLGEKLNVDYLILGSVVEYKFVRDGNNDIPVIGIAARAIDTKTGKLYWSDHQFGRGNQKEKIFGIGRIVSLSQLSEIIIKKLADSFEKRVVEDRYHKK